MQPASQSAGYEEEQPNPPTRGLAVSVTVIAAPMGVGSLGTKPSEVKRGGGVVKRVAVAKVWGNDLGSGPQL